MGDLELLRPQESEGGKRGIALAGALLGSAGILALALYLGRWAYDFRLQSLHTGRVERMLAQKPTVHQVTEALQGEGMTLAKGESCPSGTPSETTRVFVGADITYCLSFGADEKMTGFTLVPR